MTRSPSSPGLQSSQTNLRVELGHSPSAVGGEGGPAAAVAIFYYSSAAVGVKRGIPQMSWCLPSHPSFIIHTCIQLSEALDSRLTP